MKVSVRFIILLIAAFLALGSQFSAASDIEGLSLAIEEVSEIRSQSIDSSDEMDDVLISLGALSFNKEYICPMCTPQYTALFQHALVPDARAPPLLS